jgi:putative transposase
MPNYRRTFEPGGTFFLTLVTHRRTPLFDNAAARRTLHNAIVTARNSRPFDLVAAVLLPDHLHLLISLPTHDADFSTRIAAIKARFTREWLRMGAGENEQSAARLRKAYRGIWQKRFWEHLVRDESSLAACCDYIHYNPVKHGHAQCPHAWPWSSFHRFVTERRYPPEWLCVCDSNPPPASPPHPLPGAEMDK